MKHNDNIDLKEFSLPRKLVNILSSQEDKHYRGFDSRFILYKETKETKKIPIKIKFDELRSMVVCFEEDWGYDDDDSIVGCTCSYPPMKSVIGYNNTDEGCYGSLLYMWSIIYKETGEHPDKIILKISPNRNLSGKNVRDYITLAQKTGCLPKNLNKPKREDYENDYLTFEFSLKRITKERLLFYCSILRSMEPNPELLILALKYQEINIPPLVSILLPFFTLNNFHGGDSIIYDTVWIKPLYYEGNYHFPKPTIFRDYCETVKAFLKSKPKEYKYISSLDDCYDIETSWRLTHTLQEEDGFRKYITLPNRDTDENIVIDYIMGGNKK